MALTFSPISTQFPTGNGISKDDSKAKKKASTLLRGVANFIEFPSKLINQKQGLNGVVGAAASGLEVTVLALATLSQVKINGINELATLLKGVKKFFNVIEIFDNVGELTQLARKAGEPRGLIEGAWAGVKVASTVFFTIASGMEVFEFAARISGKGLKVLNFTCKGLGAVPVFGLVKDVTAGAGILSSSFTKGRELYAAFSDYTHQKERLSKWEMIKRELSDEKLPTEPETVSDTAPTTTSSEVDTLAGIGNGYEKAIKEYKFKLKSKKDAQEASESPIAEDFGEKVELSPTEYRKAARAEKNMSKWEERISLINQLKNKKTAGVAREALKRFVEVKIQRAQVKKGREVKLAAKAGTALTLNILKITLIASNILFSAFGLVGLPFTFILLGANFAIQTGSLVNYATWEYLMPKPELPNYEAAPAA